MIAENWGRSAGVAALALAFYPFGAEAQQGPQSVATGFDAKFISQGAATELGPLAAVRGAAAGRYDYSQGLATVSQTLVLARTALGPTLSLQAKGMTSRVSSSGTANESRVSTGDNAFKSLALNLNSGWRRGLAIPPPALLISGQEIVSSTTLNTVHGAHTTSLGLVSVGRLTVSGQLLGNQQLSHAGQARPNTRLYDSPTLTIFLNRQTKSGPGEPDTDSSAAGPSIDVSAIDIELRGAVVGGAKVTGHIRVGEAIAQ